MLNLIMIFTFSVSDEKYPFLANLIKKKKLKFHIYRTKVGTKINSNMLNTVVIFTCCGLYRKCSFSESFYQRIKIICLTWNLLPRLIQWWLMVVFIFLYWIKNTLFGQLWSKNIKLFV